MANSSDLTACLANARSLLFVPGNRPDRIGKALASGADAVVLDLEDSVPDEQKPAARSHIHSELQRLSVRSVPIVVRINAVQSFAGQADLEWLSTRVPADGVMIAKAESTHHLQRVREHAPDLPLLPLIESAAGFAHLSDIAGATGVNRLVVGTIDFTADTGIRCSEDERELDPLRFQVAIQTRVHGLARAVDGVTVELEDANRLAVDVQRALRFGFGGKLCIHPRQVALVHDMLAPSQEEIEWAHRVIDAFEDAGGAAVRVDGQMIDVPVVLKARSTVARASR